MEPQRTAAPTTSVMTQPTDSNNTLAPSIPPPVVNLPPASPQGSSHASTTQNQEEFASPAPVKRLPSACWGASPPAKRSHRFGKSAAVTVKVANSFSRQRKLSADIPLPASSTRNAQTLASAESSPPKRPRSSRDASINTDPSTDDEELPTMTLDRLIQRAAARRREYARRVLSALDEEKQRRRRFHEVENRFYVERLVEIRTKVSEQMISEHIATISMLKQSP
ncbi:hypothetical protein DVH05_008900 [Phytophthora capsici]|nr:hypothetical protein DVH05_008900 [Phytophthora capsici]